MVGSRDYHSSGRGRISSVKKTNTERPAGRPSRVARVEFTEDIGGVMASVFRDGKHAHNNANQASKCPVDGECLI